MCACDPAQLIPGRGGTGGRPRDCLAYSLDALYVLENDAAFEVTPDNGSKKQPFNRKRLHTWGLFFPTGLSSRDEHEYTQHNKA